jgi:hypothetical protein
MIPPSFVRSMTLRRVCCAFLAAAMIVAIEARPAAWGAVGHHIVARIAWALMTPAARDRANELLDKGGFDAFVAAGTWADEVRQDRPATYNWHFVNIHVSESAYDAAKHCAASDRGDCVVAAIARLRAQIVDADSTPLQRTEALKFLIHFVGDLHQPLHTFDNRDRGGNDVRVAALRGDDGRPTNLHAVWDTALINLSPESEAARAERLLIGWAPRTAIADLDVVKWVEGNRDISRDVAYKYPGFAPTGPPPDPVALDEAYRKAAVDVIDRQLQLGGARLAGLLNALLDR